MQITIEKASGADSERFADISKRAFHTDVDFGGRANCGPPGYDSPAFYTRILRFLDSYRIVRGDEVAGGTMAKVVGTHGVLERVFVDPRFMRSRIGSEAMRLVEEAYPHASLWSLGTPEWNTRTWRFYERLGYRQVGWDDSEPQFRGKWYDKLKVEEYPFIPIGKLRDGSNNILVEGRVAEKGKPRMVRTRKKGEILPVADATLSDDSGRITLTLWGRNIDLI